MSLFIHAAAWITLGTTIVRELLHLVLPVDAAMSLSWELALSLLPVAYLYERRHTPKRVPSWRVALAAGGYTALAVLFEHVVFPGAQARFWVTAAVTLPAVLVAQAIYYQTGLLDV
jgi:hypothetical protein